ncbi:Ribosome-binding factor A [Rosistilla ulvae]|uniref:Ribosome-binding factor A n=1 Tax=Rosistilla ulvae TaxID=1930277 RepID=A0A517LUQ4_9BACT|nr:Ribosome-binding factor A [Rosistilla ulvae]
MATSILTELRDPRVKDVTVIGVEIDSDMRNAKVRVSVMGDEKQQALSLRGLQNSAGYLQSKIAARIDTRYTPRLTFKIDKGLNNAIEVSRILEGLRKETPPPSDDTTADASDEPS